MTNTNPARGMRDFLPSDVRKREYVIGIIKEVYESYGFEPFETPAVENIETLMGKYGEEGNQLIYKILKRGEKLNEVLNSENPQSAIRNPQSLSDLALRYDLTVPLARVVANRKNDLPKFFKRYQIQPVWRADRPARGRFREFWQCDVDVVGTGSMVVEAELISAVSEILERLGFLDFKIRINHRALLSDLLALSGVAQEQEGDVLAVIDKIDKIGFEAMQQELESRGVSADVASKIWLLINGDRVEQAIEEQFRNNLANEELDQVELYLPESVKNNVVRDPSLARGLSYYTGTIMEINVPDLTGSLGGGGRYDGLIGMFGKEQIPACGFSLGLERILVLMEERGMFPPEIADSAPADVMVTIWNEVAIGESLKLANELRQKGLRVTVYPEADKIGKQLKYADSVNVPFVCIFGDDEVKQNKVQLKDMRSGEKSLLTVPEIIARLQNG